MILNLIVVAFVLGMAVLWATYGLFSAFIHMLLVLVAGSIALAVWEPVTVNLLLGAIPDYAWAVGLIGPFVIALVAMRIALDKLVGGNMQFHPLIEQIVGGACGAIAGVLTVGITIIGLSYLPLPLAFLGYQPYEVKQNGTYGASEGDTVAALWIPADRLAAQTFSFLSTHGFSSDRPLADVVPDLREDAGTVRLSRFYDENSSMVVQPDAVKIDAVQRFTGELPESVPEALRGHVTETAPTREGDQLVAVTTTFTSAKGGATFNDGLLILPPYQVQLVARESDDAPLQRFLPVGWSKLSLTSTDREFYGTVDNRSMAFDNSSPSEFIWFYAVPEGVDPAFLQVRKLRLELPGEITENDAEQFATALGRPFDEEGDGGDTEQAAAPVNNPDAANAVSDEVIGGYPNHKAVAIDLSDQLPRAISPNDATGLDIREGVVYGGKDSTSKRARGGVAARTVYIDESRQGVRVQIAPAAAAGNALGAARDAASSVGEIWLEASNGKKFYAKGYAWQQVDGNAIEVYVTDQLTSTTELPLNAYKDGDKLYLYFPVPPTVQLAKYHIGESYQEVNLTVVKQQKRR